MKARFRLLLLTLLTLSGATSNVHALTQPNMSNVAKKHFQHLPKGTNLAMLVQPVGMKTPIVAYNSDQLRLPASTQKVITALAALLELGHNYRFVTTFESKSKINNEQQVGDLVVRFSGDPSFKSHHLQSMVRKLKALGVTRISKNIILNTSLFSGHDKPVGWSWNNFSHCYSAPPSAAILDQNCFSVKITTKKESNSAEISTTSPSQAVSLRNEIRVIPVKADEFKYCEFDAIIKNNGDYLLAGCLPQKDQTIQLSFAIHNSTRYIGETLKIMLAEEGIHFNGKIVMENRPTSKGEVLVKSVSAPLSQLVTYMLKESDNITADALFRLLGHKHTGFPGTWNTGSRAVKSILKNKTSIDLSRTTLADGSGLSRNNLVSANVLMQILQYIANNNKHLKMIEMMPISGQDGTLLYRQSFKSAKLDGLIHAKTGALMGVYNLAGFITTKKGKRLAFVQLVSGYSIDTKKPKKEQLQKFETELYQELHQRY